MKIKKSHAMMLAAGVLLLVSWSPPSNDKIVDLGSGNDVDGGANFALFKGFLAGSNNKVGTNSHQGVVVGGSNQGNIANSLIAGNSNSIAWGGDTDAERAVASGVFGNSNNIAKSTSGNLIGGSSNNINGSSSSGNLMGGASNTLNLTASANNLISGSSNTVAANTSFAAGSNNTLDGPSNGTKCSHSAAIGYINQIAATRGWAMGYDNTVASQDGVAIGKYAYAGAPDSVALGKGVVTNAANSIALGRYNAGTEADDVLVVGAGSDNSNRFNAFRVTNDGGVILGRAQGDISMGEYGN